MFNSITSMNTTFGFAPAKKTPLPPYISGWPKPNPQPPYTSGWPKPRPIPQIAKTLVDSGTNVSKNQEQTIANGIEKLANCATVKKVSKPLSYLA